MKIGVVACGIMRRELEQALSSTEGITEVVFLETGKHVDPPELKKTVREALLDIQDKVDVVFLGYGYCNSLQGVGDDLDIPVVHPQMDDCIAILFTPERYEEEVTKNAGTWFMTPGWAELGTDMILNELRVDRFEGTGIDPMDIAKELFANYDRGLYIDTGVGENEKFISMANESCELFEIKLETAKTKSTVLRDGLDECVRIAKEALANR